MIERLETTLKKYNELEQELTRPEVLSDVKKTREYSKEMASLADIVNCYKKYKKTLEDIESTKEMVKDPDLGDMAKEELKALEAEKVKLDGELEILLIPKDPNDEKNVIIEIRGAAGGDEANIFAGDLFRMYTRYAEKKGFSYQVYNSVDGTAGGFSQIEFIVKGKGAYSLLKYESGSHRVQRVPVTESNGRLQTSTATVLVMPEADDDIEVEINPNDLRIDVFRASGNGGQCVNTTDSAVRITHIPTGEVVSCQDEKSQLKNKEKALKVLKARLYDKALADQHDEVAAERRSQVGTGDRSERIRTYNYPQGRVSDHRINLTLYKLDQFLDGDLDEMIDALITEDQTKKMTAI